MDGYLVFKGNEFGLLLDKEHDFISLEEAEEKFEEFIENYDRASMYEFTGYSIILVKEQDNEVNS